MKIISVVGARPNFMKAAPVYRAFKKLAPDVNFLICHTGQHYDKNMSKIFFDDLKMPEPDFYLGVGSGTHAEQTAKIMTAFEKVLFSEKPDLVMVAGDVNSTIACALTAKKLNIKVAHIEAGLRSFDMTMPEEINRILTDRISDYLFVSEPGGIKNLKNEGADEAKIFFVGNLMIDSLVEHLPKAEESKILEELGIVKNIINSPEPMIKPYILITMHRPSNVDNPEFLRSFLEMLNRVAEKRTIIFPVHPRTKSNIQKLTNPPDKNQFKLNNNIILTEPIGYLEFLKLERYAELIITDSGGIQEESTYLGVQCITIRDNTERPVTVEVGTNTLAGTNLADVEKIVMEIINGKKKKGIIPELWDGKAAERLVEVILHPV